MSEALAILRDLLNHLSPIDVVMARGLSAKEIERLHDDLLGVERAINEQLDELEDAEERR